MAYMKDRCFLRPKSYRKTPRRKREKGREGRPRGKKAPSVRVTEGGGTKKIKSAWGQRGKENNNNGRGKKGITVLGRGTTTLPWGGGGKAPSGKPKSSATIGKIKGSPYRNPTGRPKGKKKKKDCAVCSKKIQYDLIVEMITSEARRRPKKPTVPTRGGVLRAKTRRLPPSGVAQREASQTSRSGLVQPDEEKKKEGK